MLQLVQSPRAASVQYRLRIEDELLTLRAMMMTIMDDKLIMMMVMSTGQSFTRHHAS